MDDHAEDSALMFKGPCDECGSSDANAVYTDGHTYCFSCDTYGKAEGAEGAYTESRPAPRPKLDLLRTGEFRSLGKRRLTDETCRKFNYSVGEDWKGNTVQIAGFKREGQLIAQKVRYPNKEFVHLGEQKPGLWGQHLWKPGGKMLVITEGEIDCMTMSQLQGNKWPVVSLPNGVDKKGKSAVRAIQQSLEFVTSFEKVIFMFDMDEPGRIASTECSKLCKPGQAFIADLPLKDPNECHVAGRGKEVVEAMWNAKPYRPDGIVSAGDLWERVKAPKENHAQEYPWAELNKKTWGNRKGELVVWTAGSGVGKSAVVREVFFDLLRNKGQKVGMIMLEENIERTTLGMMGIEINHPLHLDRGDFTEEQLHDAFKATSGGDHLWLYDHFGSTTASNLLDRIRYLATSCECDYIVLDHISIAVSDASANDTDLDERRLIDMLMTKMRSLVEETGAGLHVISHLKRPPGVGHEEGAMTSLSQLRGSHAIAQLSDIVIGLERNQQDEDHRNETILRVLKNRFSGETGEAGILYYDQSTGRLNDTFTPTPIPATGPVGESDY